MISFRFCSNTISSQRFFTRGLSSQFPINHSSFNFARNIILSNKFQAAKTMKSYKEIIRSIRACARCMHEKLIPPSPWYESSNVSSKLEEYSRCFNDIASAYEASEQRLHEEGKKIHVDKQVADFLLQRLYDFYEDIGEPG